MSNSIFNYVSKVILDYFGTAYVNPGERFHIKYEHKDQVQDQYTVLLTAAKENNLILEPFKFNDYNSFSICYQNYKLIIAGGIQGISDDFLTGLRNNVSRSDALNFNNTAILFIHCTSLDSIVGGCKSLFDESMPLNSVFIKKSIVERISLSKEFKKHEKILLNYKIEQISCIKDADEYFLFNYSIFLDILGQMQIDTNHFNLLGLFKDDGLGKFDSSDDIEKRIGKNEEWYEIVSNGYQYGNLEKILDRTFSQKGVDSLAKENWKELDFSQVSTWAHEKDDTIDLQYEENFNSLTDELLTYWDKPESVSIVKSRVRHIIIFNEHKLEVINLPLKFNSKLNEAWIKFNTNVNHTEIIVAGKKIHLSLLIGNSNIITYKCFSYEDPNRLYVFKFNILIVPVNESLISEIKSSYLIKEKRSSWHIELNFDNSIVFNKGYDTNLFDVIKNNEQFNLYDSQSLTLKSISTTEDISQDDTFFSVLYNDLYFPFKVAPGVYTQTPITAKEVRFEKLVINESFKYNISYLNGKTNPSVFLTRRTGKWYPILEFRENLYLEKLIIDSGQPAFLQTDIDRIIPIENLSIHKSVFDSYTAIIDFFRNNSLLPSLAALTEELKMLYNNYIKSYLVRLRLLTDGIALSEAEKDLFLLGTIEMTFDTKFLKFSPLHPLNVAYLLHLNESFIDDIIPSYLLDKLRPLNLVPYIKGKKKSTSTDHLFYQPIERPDVGEWQYYFNDEVTSQQASKYFVPRLVKEKIEQFLLHFNRLLLSDHSYLRINLHNLGNANEVLQGLFLYYATFINDSKLSVDDAKQIQIHIYGSSDSITKFEELTFCNDIDSIKGSFSLKFANVQDQDELFDLYKKLVTFYKIDDYKTIDYAHLSFYQFPASEVRKSFNNVLEFPTGISLGGLLSEVSSDFNNGSFRNGFGISGLDIKYNYLIELATLFNSYVNVVYSEDQYNVSNAIAFVINSSANNGLREVFEKSQWVTFIEPKVDLKFFKDYNDVVIIHYSDQYNNASGYDAITITNKFEPYKATIKEVLNEFEVIISDESVIDIINVFNAINGQWLLNMNSSIKSNNQSRIEKLSLLSAVKSSLAILNHPSIVWVPISLGEILRVSGAVGLKQADGLFSVKNLGGEGIHSDDLLLIGLELIDGELNMYFYPIEVKMGNISSYEINKAVEQGKKTSALFKKFLIFTPGLVSKMYRNFFVKLFLNSAEKCVLYNIWPSYSLRWEGVKEFHNLLLQDVFTISENLDSYIGCYGVLLFKNSIDYLPRSIVYSDGYSLITFLKNDGLNYLSRKIDDLFEDLMLNKFDSISSDSILYNRYQNKYFDTLNYGNNFSDQLVPFNIVNKSDNLMLTNEFNLKFNNLDKVKIEAISTSIYEKLSAIGVDIKKELIIDINFIEGPAFFRIEIKPFPTTTFKKIKGCIEELNLALHLSEGESVRIFSDSGKIWLESPKKKDQRILIDTKYIWRQFVKGDSFEIPFATDIDGKVQSVNFSSSNSPHLLLAGTTGSGKSVVLDTLIRGAAKFYSPEELQIFLIDPKGNELIDFESLPHTPKPNGMSSEQAIELLQNGVDEMENRYKLFRDMRGYTGSAAKDINGYNKVIGADKLMPRWLIVLDEYSDLLDGNLNNKKEIELLLKRLSQKARAAGIHVIVATQKPLVNIISSAIKSNLPGVIALRVRTAVDSRVILDDSGAETLAGNGDALFKDGTGQMVRVQCAIHIDES